MMVLFTQLLIQCLLTLWSLCGSLAWLPPLFHQQLRRQHFKIRPTATATHQTSKSKSIVSIWMSGRGTAETYTWEEEAFEIDVTVKVPRQTRAKDVFFRATSSSIDLRLLSNTAVNKNVSDVVLLDPTRKLRGRVNVDGTYWVIVDCDESTDNDSDFRKVIVTIEKRLPTPKDDFDMAVIDYDWKGLYSNDTEVVERHYDKPEQLDIREYANSLGVDIDNIDMSKVDKTMYSSKLNLTQASLQQLQKQGLIQEITKQADGNEFTVNSNGESEPFQPFEDKIKSKEIPFLDTSSPWQATTTATASQTLINTDTKQNYTQTTRNFTRAAFAEESAKREREGDDDEFDEVKDPIDTLTVKRLKEILKSQGLRVSGTKKELKDRLRQQVNSLLQGKQE